MPNTTVPFYFLFTVCPNFPLTSFDKKKTKFKRNLRQERVRNEKMHNVIQNFQEIFIIWTWLLCLFCNLSEVESHSKRHLSFSTFATNLVFFSVYLVAISQKLRTKARGTWIRKILREWICQVSIQRILVFLDEISHLW